MPNDRGMSMNSASTWILLNTYREEMKYVWKYDDVHTYTGFSKQPVQLFR